MVGPVTVSDRARRTADGVVEIVGPVPRSGVRQWLERFDIFLFPSTCEGSPGAVAEAMMTGLPVITTPNSGTLVRDGIEGFVAAYDDVDRLSESVGRLINTEPLRLEMGRRARERALAHDLDAFAQNLAQVMRAVVN